MKQTLYLTVQGINNKAFPIYEKGFRSGESE